MKTTSPVVYVHRTPPKRSMPIRRKLSQITEPSEEGVSPNSDKRVRYLDAHSSSSKGYRDKTKVLTNKLDYLQKVSPRCFIILWRYRLLLIRGRTWIFWKTQSWRRRSEHTDGKTHMLSFSKKTLLLYDRIKCRRGPERCRRGQDSCCRGSTVSRQNYQWGGYQRRFCVIWTNRKSKTDQDRNLSTCHTKFRINLFLGQDKTARLDRGEASANDCHFGAHFWWSMAERSQHDRARCDNVWCNRWCCWKVRRGKNNSRLDLSHPGRRIKPKKKKKTVSRNSLLSSVCPVLWRFRTSFRSRLWILYSVSLVSTGTKDQKKTHFTECLGNQKKNHQTEMTGFVF